MSLADYLPILTQLLLAAALSLGILLASHLCGQRAIKNKIKDSPYECGLIAEGEPHSRFSIKFYVTAMLFIICDIEIVFLIPWALIYREFLMSDIPIFTPIISFLTIFIIGLLYVIKKGALVWEK